MRNPLPQKQGLYDPRFEHDACGIGMLVNIQGQKSHKLVRDAVQILQSLTHRGGVGAEPETGDGAGILLQLPHAFFQRVAGVEGFALPAEGAYGVGMVFSSPDASRCEESLAAFGALATREGLAVLGTRRVPTHPGCLGETAAEVCPSIHQVFLQRPDGMDEAGFERALYVVGRLAAAEIRYCAQNPDLYFYLASLSCRTVVYKGMLLPSQLAAFYLDLQDEAVATSIALVHSRFSTNTFPSWERAHPMHHIIHNGEINTIGGNVNWAKARQSRMQSELLGKDLQRTFPVINEDGSDSAMLDDFLQLLYHSGTPLEEAVMRAIPEPWQHDEHMPADKRAFYEYHSCLLEPWDGPAAIAFTDGRVAGATLDRNGLRPARYYVLTDGTLVLASEVGVLPIAAGRIVKKSRLRPGHMLLVDTAAGRIVEDGELKARAAARKPYAGWLKAGLRHLNQLPATGAARAGQAPLWQQKLFGYTYEDLDLVLRPMAEKGEDPVGSMGYDAPLAVLSVKPQLLYSYFHQLFAQVTNPPIDAIREKVVTSASVQLGAEGNLLAPDATACQVLHHTTPVLSEQDFAKLETLDEEGLRVHTLPILFAENRPGGLAAALQRLFAAADTAMQAGATILILSDRDANQESVPIPALLACAGLHHHLVRRGRRTEVSLVVDTGEAREVHHLAALVGYGANAVHPFLAYRLMDTLAAGGQLAVGAEDAKQSYQAAATGGLVKVASKMGVSTLRSYHGAQLFEALGIDEAVVERYFTGTTTRIGGVGLAEIEQEARARHAAAFAPATAATPLEAGGYVKWRKNGEYHLFNPENIFYLQQSCRQGSYELFKHFTHCVNQRSTQVKNIRGLLSITTADKPIPLDRVEPVESIVRRFKTGAMSYGSISGEAHECMAIAMNRLGGKSNSGEGGEVPERFVPGPDGRNRSSAIKQVASGRFGVTVHYLSNAVEIQIKMAQGAKPGEGGHLPGKKVYPWVARARHSTPGVSLISPPPHHDIYSIEDLAQLIHDVKNANPAARVSVKLVSEAGVGTVAVGVAKGLADVIVISGYDGGTGAAPRTSIRHAGLPWELGLAEAHQTLLLNGLRDRVVLETDGKLLTGRDIVIAALLGAEEFAFATAPLVVLGCDMMRVCNLDTCPVGIATQNPALRATFTGRPEYVENLMRFLAQEVREWMARIGVCRFEELVGRAELLRERRPQQLDKAATVDLSRLLYQPTAASGPGRRRFTTPQNHHLETTLDGGTLLPLCRPAIEKGTPVEYHLPIRNIHRAVGCRLSGEIVRHHGPEGLPAGSVRLRFAGSAGQSFGAFCTHGVSLHLAGDANDYLGKGLCGGIIAVAPPAGAATAPDDIVAGNVALYGATAGEAYICGCAGERFAVRNSGAVAVVEGVGDHGCEYMTGGRVAVLGPVGRNFAAGMSGGVAYLPVQSAAKVHQAGLMVEGLAAQDEEELAALLRAHLAATGSPRAQELLTGGSLGSGFCKVYAAAWRQMQDAMQTAHTQEEILAAFSRVAGG